MIKSLADRFAILLFLFVLSVTAACGNQSDRTSDAPAAVASVPRTTGVSEVIFNGELNGIVTVPGQGNTASAVKDAAVPAINLSSTGPKRDPVATEMVGLFVSRPSSPQR